MGKSTFVNPNPCLQHSTQIPLCIHFWKWRRKFFNVASETKRKSSEVNASFARSVQAKNSDPWCSRYRSAEKCWLRNGVSAATGH